jgi:hypothetical protein
MAPGAAKSRIFFVEPQRNAAPASTAPAQNLIFIIRVFIKNVTNYNSFLLFPFNFTPIQIRRDQEQKLP